VLRSHDGDSHVISLLLHAAFDAVTYQEIHKDLSDKNRQHYSQKGILQMLERNIKIKSGPQKWQNHKCAPLKFLS